MTEGLRRMAWSPTEAAKAAGVPVKSIYQAIHDRTLPAVKLGKHFRISDSALRLFLSESVRPAPPENLHYNVAQVSKVTGVPTKTIYKDIRSGALPAEMVDRKYRITHDALCAYLAYDATA